MKRRLMACFFFAARNRLATLLLLVWLLSGAYLAHHGRFGEAFAFPGPLSLLAAAALGYGITAAIRR